MQELDDITLLREYAERNSEEAFATLVARHINKVYSVALRQTNNPHSAEEITQAVFVILATKANKLVEHTMLSGWLYQTARLTAVTFIRSEIRRTHREQEAYMQNLLNESASEVWPRIAPMLDAAMGHLNDTERHAVVLRFFDGKSINEVGVALGSSEEAAKKRISRAVEKLQKFFFKRGVDSSATAIAESISVHSVQSAPALLAKTVTVVALSKGTAVSTSTLTLIKGALKVMAWTKMKTAVVTGVVVLLAAGTIVVKNDFFPGEPSYQGKRLSEWLVDVDYGQPDFKRTKAANAIRKMGAKTIPFLLADLGDDRFKNYVTKQNKGTDDRRNSQATWGFDALGSTGKPAIPELEKIMAQNPGYVLSALGGIGRDALPELLAALTNESFWVRDNAAAALANAIDSHKITSDEASAAFPIAIANLSYTSTNEVFQGNTRSRAAGLIGALRLQPDVSVPALMQELNYTNDSIVMESVYALGYFERQATPAVPALTTMAGSTNEMLRRAAKFSLEEIQRAPVQ